MYANRCARRGLYKHALIERLDVRAHALISPVVRPEFPRLPVTDTPGPGPVGQTSHPVALLPRILSVTGAEKLSPVSWPLQSANKERRRNQYYTTGSPHSNPARQGFLPNWEMPRPWAHSRRPVTEIWGGGCGNRVTWTFAAKLGTPRCSPEQSQQLFPVILVSTARPTLLVQVCPIIRRNLKSMPLSRSPWSLILSGSREGHARMHEIPILPTGLAGIMDATPLRSRRNLTGAGTCDGYRVPTEVTSTVAGKHGPSRPAFQPRSPLSLPSFGSPKATDNPVEA